MDNIQFWGVIIAFVTNIVILVTQFIQIYKIKKEIKDVKIVVNNTVDIKRALSKSLEGIWEVRGSYSKYHGNNCIHNCMGFADFVWDDINKRYDVYYVYSVRKEGDTTDLVTAFCKGIAVCNEIGALEANQKLILQMIIQNRSSRDIINNNSTTFEFVSNKIIKYGNKINKIEFPSKNKNMEGTVYFTR